MVEVGGRTPRVTLTSCAPVHQAAGRAVLLVYTRRRPVHRIALDNVRAIRLDIG